MGVLKEIASGAKQERAERKKLLALAQARTVDLILVTELTSWGCSVLNVLKIPFRVFSSKELIEGEEKDKKLDRLSQSKTARSSAALMICVQKPE